MAANQALAYMSHGSLYPPPSIYILVSMNTYPAAAGYNKKHLSSSAVQKYTFFRAEALVFYTERKIEKQQTPDYCTSLPFKPLPVKRRDSYTTYGTDGTNGTAAAGRS